MYNVRTYGGDLDLLLHLFLTRGFHRIVYRHRDPINKLLLRCPVLPEARIILFSAKKHVLQRKGGRLFVSTHHTRICNKIVGRKQSSLVAFTRWELADSGDERQQQGNMRHSLNVNSFAHSCAERERDGGRIVRGGEQENELMLTDRGTRLITSRSARTWPRACTLSVWGMRFHCAPCCCVCAVLKMYVCRIQANMMRLNYHRGKQRKSFFFSNLPLSNCFSTRITEKLNNNGGNRWNNRASFISERTYCISIWQCNFSFDTAVDSWAVLCNTFSNQFPRRRNFNEPLKQKYNIAEVDQLVIQHEW